MSISNDFGVTRQDLIEINGVTYPETLETIQKLKDSVLSGEVNGDIEVVTVTITVERSTPESLYSVLESYDQHEIDVAAYRLAH